MYDLNERRKQTHIHKFYLKRPFTLNLRVQSTFYLSMNSNLHVSMYVKNKQKIYVYV